MRWESRDGTLGVKVDDEGIWLTQPQIPGSEPILLGNTRAEIKEIRALLFAAEKELPQ